ncbi:uncharacterized protein LOC130892380 [Diorhabda carinulata]|uniref:uncharacterized protein LOC130892380 n=1 Tax=Diorhabda carinulata TaxID=1163345 RepID=UPI0025A21EFF|nr:uncharacterized protein LOC130892380 [Diorhabda carinulata]
MNVLDFRVKTDIESKGAHKKVSELQFKSTDVKIEGNVTHNRKVDTSKITKTTSLKKSKNDNGSTNPNHKSTRRVTFGAASMAKPTLSRTQSVTESLRRKGHGVLSYENTDGIVTSSCKAIHNVVGEKNKQEFYARYETCLKNCTSVLVTGSPGVRKRIHPTGSYFSGTLNSSSMRRTHETDRLLLTDHSNLHETERQKNDDGIVKERRINKHTNETIIKDDYPEICCHISDSSPQTCRPIKTSVLLNAARVGNISWLRELIDYNLKFGFRDVNAVDRNGRTLLTWLASRGIADVLNQLSRIKNINPNLGDNEGNTPLHFAVRYERTEFLNLFLVYFRGRLTIDRRNVLGFTPLMCAAIDGRSRSAQLLLLSGADPTLRDFGRNLRADQWALHCSRLVCAEVILRQIRELLKFPDSSRNWDSQINMEVVFCRGSARKISCDSSREEGFGMKFRQIFRRTSTLPHDKNLRAKLMKQLTAAAFCATSPALPSREYLPPNDGNTSTEIIDYNVRNGIPSTSDNSSRSYMSSSSSISNISTSSKSSANNDKKSINHRRASNKK